MVNASAGGEKRLARMTLAEVAARVGYSAEWAQRLNRCPFEMPGRLRDDGFVHVDPDELDEWSRLYLQWEARTEKAQANADPRVYFVQAVAGGPIKIGMSTNPIARLLSLQMGCPARLRLLATTIGGQALERHLHQRFAAARLHGEWFEPTDDLLALVRELQEIAHGTDE